MQRPSLNIKVARRTARHLEPSSERTCHLERTMRLPLRAGGGHRPARGSAWGCNPPNQFPMRRLQLRAGTIPTTSARGVLEPPPGLQTRSWAAKWPEQWWWVKVRPRGGRDFIHHRRPCRCTAQDLVLSPGGGSKGVQHDVWAGGCKHPNQFPRGGLQLRSGNISTTTARKAPKQDPGRQHGRNGGGG